MIWATAPLLAKEFRSNDYSAVLHQNGIISAAFFLNV
jgi:hypothetical protein